LKTSQQWHIEQRHGELTLRDEGVRLYRRKGSAARRASRLWRNYFGT